MIEQGTAIDKTESRNLALSSSASSIAMFIAAECGVKSLQTSICSNNFIKISRGICRKIAVMQICRKRFANRIAASLDLTFSRLLTARCFSPFGAAFQKSPWGMNES
jgi:hypothetical protein